MTSVSPSIKIKPDFKFCAIVLSFAVFPAVIFYVQPLARETPVLRNKRACHRPPGAFLSLVLDRCRKIGGLAAAAKIEFDYVLFPFCIKRLAEVPPAFVGGTLCQIWQPLLAGPTGWVPGIFRPRLTRPLFCNGGTYRQRFLMSLMWFSMILNASLRQTAAAGYGWLRSGRR